MEKQIYGGVPVPLLKYCKHNYETSLSQPDAGSKISEIYERACFYPRKSTEGWEIFLRAVNEQDGYFVSTIDVFPKVTEAKLCLNWVLQEASEIKIFFR